MNFFIWKLFIFILNFLILANAESLTISLSNILTKLKDEPQSIDNFASKHLFNERVEDVAFNNFIKTELDLFVSLAACLKYNFRTELFVFINYAHVLKISDILVDIFILISIPKYVENGAADLISLLFLSDRRQNVVFEARECENKIGTINFWAIKFVMKRYLDCPWEIEKSYHMYRSFFCNPRLLNLDYDHEKISKCSHLDLLKAFDIIIGALDGSKESIGIESIAALTYLDLNLPKLSNNALNVRNSISSTLLSHLTSIKAQPNLSSGHFENLLCCNLESSVFIHTFQNVFQDVIIESIKWFLIAAVKNHNIVALKRIPRRIVIDQICDLNPYKQIPLYSQDFSQRLIISLIQYGSMNVNFSSSDFRCLIKNIHVLIESVINNMGVSCNWPSPSDLLSAGFIDHEGYFKFSAYFTCAGIPRLFKFIPNEIISYKTYRDLFNDLNLINFDTEFQSHLLQFLNPKNFLKTVLEDPLNNLIQINNMAKIYRIETDFALVASSNSRIAEVFCDYYGDLYCICARIRSRPEENDIVNLNEAPVKIFECKIILTYGRT